MVRAIQVSNVLSNTKVIYDLWSYMTFQDGLEVMGNKWWFKLGWDFVDRQAAYHRTKK